MEEDTTCSLCMEAFTDPVSLPCDHGFCRGCLKTVVGHNTRIKAGEEALLDPSPSVLCCPLCRAELTLGASGVDELQPNQFLSALLSGRTENKGDVITAPLCDMCEEEKEPAKSYCVNCMALYCTQCLSTLHPRRGPFGRHQLISMMQYLGQKSSHEDAGNTSPADALANCSDHKQPLSLYCGTCERPICNGCVSQHNDHVMQDVSTAYSRKKTPVEHQVDSCRELLAELQKLQTELTATQKDVQTKIEQEYKDVEANYQRCLEHLLDWRKSERDKVDEKRDKLTSESLSTLKTINMLIEETESLMTSSAKLLGVNEAQFLLESKELIKRVQCHSTESKQGLADKRRKMEEIRSALSRCDFRPCVVTTPEGTDGITVGDVERSEKAQDTQPCKRQGSPESDPALLVQAPKLEFTESDDPDVAVITGDGAVVALREDQFDSFRKQRNTFTAVRTDGLLTAGSQYWEMEITWYTCMSFNPTTDWICSVGVRQEGSQSNKAQGRDAKSWAVDIMYNAKKRKSNYRFWHRNKTFGMSKLMSCNESWPSILGFLLSAAGRTLTVVDVKNDTQLFVFREMELSRPLIPEVEFGCNMSGGIFRLPSVDTSCLPKLVMDQL